MLSEYKGLAPFYNKFTFYFSLIKNNHRLWSFQKVILKRVLRWVMPLLQRVDEVGYESELNV